MVVYTVGTRPGQRRSENIWRGSSCNQFSVLHNSEFWRPSLRWPPFRMPQHLATCKAGKFKRPQNSDYHFMCGILRIADHNWRLFHSEEIPRDNNSMCISWRNLAKELHLNYATISEHFEYVEMSRKLYFIEDINEKKSTYSISQTSKRFTQYIEEKNADIICQQTA